eukprot:COSAG01_NODE_15398_length_1342_cov_2.244969_1_plen_93_part_00
MASDLSVYLGRHLNLFLPASDHLMQLKRVGVRRRARVSHCARYQQPQLGHAQRRLLVRRRATGGEFSTLLPRILRLRSPSDPGRHVISKLRQ